MQNVQNPPTTSTTPSENNQKKKLCLARRIIRAAQIPSDGGDGGSLDQVGETEGSHLQGGGGVEELSKSLANYTADLSVKFVKERGDLHGRLLGRFPHQVSQVPIPPGQVYAINDTISAAGAVPNLPGVVGEDRDLGNIKEQWVPEV
ncbi:hypothetical protein QJS04_geneDACA006997 [Acorus gramineus]|uniref:Uncharacterized protein n=1 Tax=Acorus gramineus TaxID=55184 RepID=A0AAV9A2M3_ACOGR|nr:hypothetical protein QJS04_geneDACA006997 [Acorus gramineus]